jgi:cystathionine gamma-synthase/methionine-gamma-lyase
VSNPLERVADLQAILDLARQHGVAVLVDSTFTTPYLIRPLALGAACALHSATKYLGGHGDVTGGVVACATREQAAALRTWRKYTGAVLGASDAYLALRGVRTLALRMARQCTNAQAIAEALARHAAVERVHYPGLPNSPDHATAARLFPSGLAGAVLAFAIRDADKPGVMRFMERLQLIRAAPTLGDCFSLVLYPLIASHRGLTPEQRRERGINDNVVRLSAGIEDPADLVADLEQALAA